MKKIIARLDYFYNTFDKTNRKERQTMKNSEQKNAWVQVITFNLPQDSYTAKAYLESEGIIVFLKDEMTTQVFNFSTSAIGGVKMLVPTEQAELAVQLHKEGGYFSRTHTKCMGTKKRKPCDFLFYF